MISVSDVAQPVVSIQSLTKHDYVVLRLLTASTLHWQLRKLLFCNHVAELNQRAWV